MANLFRQDFDLAAIIATSATVCSGQHEKAQPPEQCKYSHRASNCDWWAFYCPRHHQLETGDDALRSEKQHTANMMIGLSYYPGQRVKKKYVCSVTLASPFLSSSSTKCFGEANYF